MPPTSAGVKGSCTAVGVDARLCSRLSLQTLICTHAQVPPMQPTVPSQAQLLTSPMMATLLLVSPG